MSNTASELATAQTTLLEQDSTQSVQSNQANKQANKQANVDNTESIDSNQPASAAQPNKLPYQVSHQVELLHLQAEIDALLGQLQNLKQQRLASDQTPDQAPDQASEVQDSEIHALV